MRYDASPTDDDRPAPDELRVFSDADLEHAAHRLLVDMDAGDRDWYNSGYVDGVCDLLALLIDGDTPQE